jgi:hypothetical protein
MQLMQARSAPGREPATLAFGHDEIAVLDRLNAQGTTKLQKNPHRNKSLKRGSWIIAKLGGWDGYYRPSRRGRSPSNMVSKNSMLSSQDGASEMCASPSRKREREQHRHAI